jgi:hypothetical protein
MSLAIEAFVENARGFCRWVESERHDVATVRQPLLALLQGVPYLVTQAGPEEELEYPRRGHGGWQSDHKRFTDFPFQYYRVVFSPCDIEDDDPVTGNVHDDLADIYADLWHGLQALDRGGGVYAVRHWRESYFQHWGHHASSAIYAIDEYYRRSQNDEETD